MLKVADCTTMDEFGHAVRLLAEEELEPIAADFGERPEVCRPLLQRLGDLGFFQLLNEELDQGEWLASHRWSAFVAVREALALVDSQLDEAFTIQSMGLYPILMMGTPEQRERFATELTSGRRISAFALSEPEAGSDVTAMSTTATRDGSGWRLSGDKTWISHAPDAETYVVFARHDEASGVRGFSAFIVERDSEGFTALPSFDLLAPHALGALELRDVYVPESQVLGEPGSGLKTALKLLEHFRPSVGGRAVGLARHALDVAAEWAQGRQLFGAPLIDQQSAAFRLADMAIQIQAARALIYEAGRQADIGQKGWAVAGSSAKVFATEVAQKVAYDAQQICGARAMVAGHPAEMLYRQVRAMTVYEGTSEIQRLIVGRHIQRGNLDSLWNF